MFSWDDVAIFLALCRERTTGRAAAALGVSQPTVVRRIAALEQALGLKLFERTPTGLDPTEAARQLMDSAERVERGICNFTNEVDSLTETALKVVRLTLLDHFEQLMVPVLRDFRSRWPSVHAELLPSDRMYDLQRGEADIAIRGRAIPETDELVVRDMPPCGWAIYESVDNCPEERPRSLEDLRHFPIALVDGPPGKLPVYQWLDTMIPDGQAPIRCSNFRALSSTIASGAAISALPCTMGDSNPQLVRRFGPVKEFDVPVYLIARRPILRRPAARDLFEAIHSYFMQRPTLLSGKDG